MKNTLTANMDRHIGLPLLLTLALTFFGCSSDGGNDNTPQPLSSEELASWDGTWDFPMKSPKTTILIISNSGKNFEAPYQGSEDGTDRVKGTLNITTSTFEMAFTDFRFGGTQWMNLAENGMSQIVKCDYKDKTANSATLSNCKETQDLGNGKKTKDAPGGIITKQ